MNYKEVIESISNNLINYFDEVYHSAEIIINDEGIKEPAISKNDEWISLVPTDQKEIIYIRRNGDDDVWEDLKIGSCIKSYKMRTPLRIVYFKDHCNNQDEIMFKLMQSVLISGTKLRSIIRDKWRLQKEESSGEYNLGATSIYFAIDLLAFWELKPDTCQEDFCVELENPLKKCLVVENQS